MTQLDDSTCPATSPVKDFVNSTITQIMDGLPEYAHMDTNGQITMEMVTVAEITKTGKVDTKVLIFGGDTSKYQTNKIIAKVGINNEKYRKQKIRMKN